MAHDLHIVLPCQSQQSDILIAEAGDLGRGDFSAELINIGAAVDLVAAEETDPRLRLY